jgi:hypothetical protein
MCNDIHIPYVSFLAFILIYQSFPGPNVRPGWLIQVQKHLVNWSFAIRRVHISAFLYLCLCFPTVVFGSLVLHFKVCVHEQWQTYHNSYICSGHLIGVSYPPDYCCGEPVCDSSLCLLFLEKYSTAYVTYWVVNIMVKESCDRPDVAQRVPGGVGSQISMTFSLTHRPPLPQELFLVLIFTRGWVDPRAMEWLEGDMSLKNPVTPPGIDPGTIQLVAQRLNHYTTPGPSYEYSCDWYICVCVCVCV